jgi:hypothetical protein
MRARRSWSCVKSVEERTERFEKTFVGWEPEVLQWLLGDGGGALREQSRT